MSQENVEVLRCLRGMHGPWSRHVLLAVRWAGRRVAFGGESSAASRRRRSWRTRAPWALVRLL